MRALIFCIAFFLSLTSFAEAPHSVKNTDEDCPWWSLPKGDLRPFLEPDHARMDVFNLTADQVSQDLACARLILKNSYAVLVNPSYRRGSHLLASRVEQQTRVGEAMTNVQLRDHLLALHTDVLDLHLGYRAAGTVRQKSSVNTLVTREKLESDKIYEREHYVYFKPSPTDTRVQLTPNEKLFVDKYLAKDVKNVVVDLRDNHGGTTFFVDYVTQNLFHYSLNLPTEYAFFVRSPLTRLLLNRQTRSVGGTVDDKEEAALLRETRQMSFQDLLTHVHQDRPRTQEPHGRRIGAFKPNLVVFTDSTCASACEQLAFYLQLHPNSLILGAPTNGASTTGNLLPYTLPHSKVRMFIPALATKYEDMASEGTGTQPDYERSEMDLNGDAFRDLWLKPFGTVPRPPKKHVLDVVYKFTENPKRVERTNTCRWWDMKGKDFVLVNTPNEPDLLNAQQVQEDVDCFELLLSQVSVHGHVMQPPTQYILDNLMKKLSKEGSLTGSRFQEILAEVESYRPLHGVFYLRGSVQKRAPSRYSGRTSLRGELEHGNILEKENYVLYRPEKNLSNYIMRAEERLFSQYIMNGRKNIVLDLRGVEGYSPRLANRLRYALRAHELIPKEMPWSNFGVANSPFIAIGRMNASIIDLNYDLDEYTMAAFKKTSKMSFENLVKGQFISTDPIATQPFAGFKGRIIIVMDSTCRFGCEYLVRNLKNLDNVILVGQETSGDFLGFQPAAFALPNSQIKVFLPTAFEYGGDAHSRSGFYPHLTRKTLDLNTDPMRHLWQNP